MGLETVTHISDLVATNPATGDQKSEGDDHLRNIKSALKTDLPNITGPVTATQDELNILDGVTATAAELNILDGVTKTAAEINDLVEQTDPVLNGTVTGTAFLDEDTLSSDSATKLASQQSIKAYVDSRFSHETLATPSSGTSKTYTVPSGAKRIIVMFDDLDLDSYTEIMIGVSDGTPSSCKSMVTMVEMGSPETLSASNYTTAVVYATDGYAGGDLHGVITFTLMDSATYRWVYSGVLHEDSPTGYDKLHTSGGTVVAAGEVSEVSIQGGTFQSQGSVNVAFEY